MFLMYDGCAHYWSAYRKHDVDGTADPSWLSAAKSRLSLYQPCYLDGNEAAAPWCDVTEGTFACAVPGSPPMLSPSATAAEAPAVNAAVEGLLQMGHPGIVRRSTRAPKKQKMHDVQNRMLASVH